MKTTREQQDQIEGIIDNTDIEALLNGIADICYGKGEHLRSNWQDEYSAKKWEMAAKQVEKVATAIVNKW